MLQIHRYWDGPPQAEHQWTARVVTSLHPGAALTDWTPEGLPPDVRVLTGSGDVRHDANMVRYALLSQFGGLWLDHDVIPLRSLLGSARCWTAGVGQCHEGSVMWFPKAHHPLLSRLLHYAHR